MAADQTTGLSREGRLVALIPTLVFVGIVVWMALAAWIIEYVKAL